MESCEKRSPANEIGMTKNVKLFIKLISLLFPFVIGGLVMGLTIWQSFFGALILVSIFTSIVLIWKKIKSKYEHRR